MSIIITVIPRYRRATGNLSSNAAKKLIHRVTLTLSKTVGIKLVLNQSLIWIQKSSFKQMRRLSSVLASVLNSVLAEEFGFKRSL